MCPVIVHMYSVSNMYMYMKRLVIPGEVKDDGSEMIQQLREVSVDNRVSNCRFLVLPKSWSLRNSTGIWCDEWHENSAELRHLSYVSISDCLYHNE